MDYSEIPSCHFLAPGHPQALFTHDFRACSDKFPTCWQEFKREICIYEKQYVRNELHESKGFINSIWKTINRSIKREEPSININKNLQSQVNKFNELYIHMSEYRSPLKINPWRRDMVSALFKIILLPVVIQRTRVRFPAGRPWSCIFRNLSRFGSYNIYLNDTRIS